jgi:uncharacterized membrane protein
MKGFFKGAWRKLTGKAKGGKGAKRPVNILETAMVGAPIELVWDAWRDFEQWPTFMKGPESVKTDRPKDKDEQGEQDKGDDEPETSTWTAKIFLNRRQWKSTVTEQVDYERIRWKSEGNKGTVDGVVSFTPIGDNATLVVLVLEYRSKGFFETIGKTWRVQGRRARLDFKHFQRHIAMADQADALNRPEGDDEQRDGSEPAEPGDAGAAGGAGEPGSTDGEPGESGEPNGAGEPDGQPVEEGEQRQESGAPA